MAHFNINQPGNLAAGVRQGKVMNKTVGLFKHWPWVKIKAQEKKGYIVTLGAVGDKDKKQYHLVKTTTGMWPSETTHELNLAIKTKGKWQAIKDDKITLAIKKAIDDYENK